jgi:adenylosuccinate lyase
MVVYPDRMRANLDSSHGLVFSQPVLLALVETGMTRDDAYRVVQRDAARTWEQGRPFRDILGEDPEVVDALGVERLDDCFDLDRALQHAGRAVDLV